MNLFHPYRREIDALKDRFYKRFLMYTHQSLITQEKKFEFLPYQNLLINQRGGQIDALLISLQIFFLSIYMYIKDRNLQLRQEIEFQLTNLLNQEEIDALIGFTRDFGYTY